ncbi:MAG: DUF5916 domain-containing protein [Gemmatimonadaceae bacterium]
MLLPLAVVFQLAAGTTQPTYSGRLGQTTVAPPKIEATIVVDGNLDEPVWRQAALLTGFSLYSPTDGRPSPDSTAVLVWYSSDAIYFGIRAFEPHGPASASLADRDRVSADDNVEIHLDTFDERNRAFVFIVNPLGVQADGTKSEAGGFIPGSNVGPGQNDLSADFIWQSRGHVTDWGYEVEVRIPFSSLRYPVKSPQRWGLQIDRHVQHSGYEETWTPAVRASASFIVQEGTLTGLTGMHHGQIVELNPELTNTVNGSPCCSPALRDWKYSGNPQFGGNIRWTLGSNYVLNGTIKPDFSQIEADATQIAADARFALFYPEKRPFFVEGLDQFNVPNTLVYTRTIVQPDEAVKLTGKLGRADVAVMSALNQRQTSYNGERPLVDIVRLRQSFGDQSLAGLLYSERVGKGLENRVLGGDTHLVFWDKYYAQFQLAESATRLNGVTRSGPMWEAVVDGTGRQFGFHYNIIGISPNFRADNGFVPRVGYVQPGVSNRVSWYGSPGAFVERFTAFVTVNGLWQYPDFFAMKSLLEDHASLNLTANLRGGWSVGLSPKLSSYAFAPSDYTNLYVSTFTGATQTGVFPFTPSPRIESLLNGVTVSSPQFQSFTASAGATLGTDVDFLETSRVRRVDYNASLDLRPSKQLRIGATYVSSAFARRSDDQRSAFTYIPRVKIEYQLARPLFVRVVSQYTATKRTPLLDPRTGEVLLTGVPGSLTSAPLNVSNGLRTDWLLSYRPSPGTVFFLGYGGSLSEPDPLAFQRLRRTDDAFFIKLSYVFRTASR